MTKPIIPAFLRVRPTYRIIATHTTLKLSMHKTFLPFVPHWSSENVGSISYNNNWCFFKCTRYRGPMIQCFRSRVMYFVEYLSQFRLADVPTATKNNASKIVLFLQILTSNITSVVKKVVSVYMYLRDRTRNDILTVGYALLWGGLNRPLYTSVCIRQFSNLRAPISKTKRRKKQNGVNVLQSRSNRCVNFQLEKSKVRRTAAHHVGIGPT